MIFSSFIDIFPIRKPSILGRGFNLALSRDVGRSEELLPAEVRNATGITREHFMNVIMEPRR
jgi:hypothetical protein